jgi:hypothetical protein
MNQQRALFLLVLVALGILLLAFFYTRDAKRKIDTPLNNLATDSPLGGENTAAILKRTYQDGTHTWEGAISLPTPCTRLETPTVTVAESYPELVRISLVSVASADICAQVITERTFTVSFQASEKATVSITLDGKPLSLVFTDTNTPAKTLLEGEKPTLVQ